MATFKSLKNHLLYTPRNFDSVSYQFLLFKIQTLINFNFSQPRLDNRKLVKVIDFGVGNYSTDYTGHAFLGTYLYDKRKFILNNSVEYSNNWKRPYQGFKSSSKRKKRSNPFAQTFNQPSYYIPNQNLKTDQKDASKYKNNNQPPTQNSYLPDFMKAPISSISQLSEFVYVNKQKIPIYEWDPLVDTERNNLNRLPDRNSPIGFDQWYVDSLVKNTALQVFETSHENPFTFKDLTYIETYRFAKTWWKNETFFRDNRKK